MNPYLEEFLKIDQDSMDRYSKRIDLCNKYAWSIPDDEAIRLIESKTNKLISIGAGAGYWESFFKNTDVVACDLNPPNVPPYINHWHKTFTTWFPVRQGTPPIIKDYPKHTLFLSWPPYDDPMAYDCLKYYKGDLLIYIGEGAGGCTADDAFHDALDKEWNLLLDYPIPQWPGIHDSLNIYSRR